MGTLNKLKAKTVVCTDDAKKENEAVINNKRKPSTKKGKQIMTAADFMKGTNFSNCSPIFIPKKKRK